MLVDFGSAQCEKFSQLGRIESSIVFAIQFEPNAAAPGKVAGEIVERKFPFWRAPKVGLFVIVKTNHESGNEIELFSEIGKGNEGMNTPDHAWYT